MPTLNTQLVKILNQVKRPGTYYTRSRTEWHLPTIEVNGVGKLALPVLPQQAEQLINHASLAPYGKGEETLLDTSVRNTWQIAAEQIHITGKHWQPMLDGILKEVRTSLGVQGSIVASLYKLLIYGPGSFFVDHRDSEKENGMFGSLIIGLPSDYNGGELCLKHAGQEVQFDLHTDDASEIAFAAFYADCVHEVLPVATGYRVVLAYNLCIAQETGSDLPKPPEYQTEQQQVKDLLTHWTDMEHSGEDIPLKLIYLLEHAYTPEGLAFTALKNGDAAIADVVTSAAEKADCDCYLALISVEERGIADDNGGYGYYDDEPDDFEIIEVLDERQFVSQWQQPDGSETDLGKLPFEDEELCLPERLKKLESDNLVFQEATGNEGATFERTYHRAALVLWPRQYVAETLAAGGVTVSVPYLAKQAQQCLNSAQNKQESLRVQNHRLTKAIIRDWPDVPESRPYAFYYDFEAASPQNMLSDFLKALVMLQDTQGIEMALRQIAINGKAYRGEDNPAIVAALNLLSPELATEILTELLKRRTPKALSACAQLMRQALPLCISNAGHGFRQVADTFLTHLPNASSATAYYHPDPPLSGTQIADMLIALGYIDEAITKQIVDKMIARRRAFPMDGTLVPATVLLTETDDSPIPVQAYVKQACLDSLETAIAESLEAPQDWVREASFECQQNNEDCQRLKTYLLSPNQETWNFAAAEKRRKSLQRIAQYAGLDVKMETIKQGSPHTLRFTKTDASYQQRVQQRKTDEKNRDLLRSL